MYVAVLNSQMIFLFLFLFLWLTLIADLFLKWKSSTSSFDGIMGLSAAMHCAGVGKKGQISCLLAHIPQLQEVSNFLHRKNF